MTRRHILIRILAVLSVILGVNYIVWRWLASINWEAWWIAVPLVIAETYSLVDTFLFSTTMWRARQRPAPASPPQGTVDVFITTYNEPLDLVMTTARAAKRITYPHNTWVLDDGARPEMEQAARDAGIGYLTRSEDWTGKPRHAKAGNLNNALFQTEGEFLLILDADQIPDPLILDRTLGYFADDPAVALVQTPQYFSNVTESDPLGSQAPLFYGPIQQGKDGWNAAFFCGSNAVLRREALMQMGIVGYVKEIEDSTRTALIASERLIRKEARRATDPFLRQELTELRTEITRAREKLTAGEPVGEITFALRESIDRASQRLLSRDFATIQEDLEVIDNLPVELDRELVVPVVSETGLDQLTSAELSPLGAVETVGALLDVLTIDRGGEAQPIQPIATISVTEDMATAMQLHSMGWHSVYHHEILAHGLAPEDLRTMLTQRLRWAQGTMQVMLRDNPLLKKGLSAGQRLMYFATMWSYLSGFTALVYLAAPVIYLLFGVMPVTAWSLDFFLRFLPYFLVNQALFLVVAKGTRTWRGQQYSLALFPVWIAACWTAARNVWFGRPLNFAVTKKDGRDERGIPWRQIWPQLSAIAVLGVAVVIGLVRVAVGTADGTGTLVNTAWVIYDLVVLSVIIEAARYRGPSPAPAEPSTIRPEGHNEYSDNSN
ncbi:glycosyltransferase [Corynebacterium guangdongense]|uniref:Cellulose synthase (UDP-forming) n=1 Tax=Corynebacterium guangdongense TaxID=1783348 RepID=A0ABU1ZXI9_9CORY|nr:glycosyltransferase [Corynebacterium guangdongense]MDR7329657.1 cellulose synthase (UDP-forming) [Corynebacterium guangdongense]WJZ18221.1 Cellulose synthase catalytic subunit [UDP-forming] [Corynebacterium guangdongense]